MSITQEWQRVVKRLYNFPSIIAWVPINESWGVDYLYVKTNQDPRVRYHLDALYNMTKALDPTRMVISNDGWESATTDLVSIHDYTQSADDLTRRYENFKADRKGNSFTHGGAIILPEYLYAGQPIMITEYGGVKVEEQGADCLGYCYTQLTDVEQEVNGLVRFDRKEKVSLDRYAEIIKKTR